MLGWNNRPLHTRLGWDLTSVVLNLFIRGNLYLTPFSPCKNLSSLLPNHAPLSVHVHPHVLKCTFILSLLHLQKKIVTSCHQKSGCLGILVEYFVCARLKCGDIGSLGSWWCYIPGWLGCHLLACAWCLLTGWQDTWLLLCMMSKAFCPPPPPPICCQLDDAWTQAHDTPSSLSISFFLIHHAHNRVHIQTHKHRCRLLML